jgi:hypothetical protein
VQRTGSSTDNQLTGRARILTPAEKELVQSIIAGTDRGGVQTRVPRSTRKFTLTRIYLRELIRDRYVPYPPAVGWPFVTVALTQPFSEKVASVRRTWESEPGLTLLWGSYGILFGVFFSRSSDLQKKLWDTLSNQESGHGTLLIGQDLRNSSIPLFFDFEAAWGRVIGNPGLFGYPQSLPKFAQANVDLETEDLSKGEMSAVERLVARPFIGPPRVSRSQGISRPFLGGPETRCLQKGLVEFRSFLNPIAVARDATDFPKRITFVHGRLLEQSAPEKLFHDLVEEGGASPFLFMTDGRTVMLGALSRGNERSSRNIESTGRIILPILNRNLQSIVTLEADLGSIDVFVDHRYDRLI